MKTLSAALLGLILAAFARAEIRPMDASWKFSLGDFAGAERPAFDDSGWRTLNLPHDWGVEGAFNPLNPAGGAGAFLPTGVGWYRKRFTLPAEDAGKRLYIAFEGVMMNSDVWINGTHLGRRPYGYVSFRYELPARSLKFGPGQENVLAVRVNDADQPASRWYAGAGIYRHVRLEVFDPVHLEQDSAFVSTPVATADTATVHLSATVVNESDANRLVSLHLTVILDQRPPAPPEMMGEQAAQFEVERQTFPQTVPAHGSASFALDVPVTHPRLWNLDDPELYRGLIQLDEGSGPQSRSTGSWVTFGIRDAHFEAATGFWLNGRNLKVKGVAIHSEGSAFGAAVPMDVWARRLAILRSLGVNAIRCAHNPPDPEFLNLCDRMGFLVMDEMFDCWTVAKNIADYHLYFREWSKTDARDTVRRDRNHPSIILWSAGNEIHDTPNAALSKEILAGLIQVFHENDPTRPVTQALLRPNASHDYTDGLADMLDVIGTNYRDSELLAAHEARPSRKIIGTENHQDREAWLAVRDHAAYSGDFLWAGIDYLGESPRWPTVSSRSGLIDRDGTPRPQGYERESWWSDQPNVHIVRRTGSSAPRVADPGYGPVNYRLRREVLFRDWNPSDTGPHEESVEIYSNCESVELFLNGRSLGAQQLRPDASARVWKVAFAPGVLRAVASNGGKVVATDELRTAGAPARIVLVPDKRTVAADWDGVATVEADVVDANGVLAPGATNQVHFDLAGPGDLRVDSGDNSSHEPFLASDRRAYQGRCFALVQVRREGAGSSVTLTASSPGLESSSVAIEGR